MLLNAFSGILRGLYLWVFTCIAVTHLFLRHTQILIGLVVQIRVALLQDIVFFLVITFSHGPLNGKPQSHNRVQRQNIGVLQMQLLKYICYVIYYSNWVILQCVLLYYTMIMLVWFTCRATPYNINTLNILRLIFTSLEKRYNAAKSGFYMSRHDTNLRIYSPKVNHKYFFKIFDPV